MSRFRRLTLFTVLSGLLLAPSLTIAQPAQAVSTAQLPAPARQSAAGTAPFVSRITAHDGQITDRAGRRWAARPATLGTRKVSKSLVGRDIAGTRDDQLYQVMAWGGPGYLLPVPARDTYTVRLLMAEPTFTKAGARVFAVKAEGRVVAPRVDIAAAVGRGRAYQVSFPVAVHDGELTIEFVTKVQHPVVSAIEVVGRSRLQSSALAGAGSPAVRFAPGNIFATRVDRAPLAKNSARVAARLAAQVRNNWGGIAATNAYAYNVGFNVAAKGTKRIDVGFHNCQRKRGRIPGLYDGPAHFAKVPVPPGARAAHGTDAQMTIYDQSADQLWEFWQMRRNASTGRWEACWGGRIDKVSTQTRPVFANNFGASASGLPIAGGMITVDDIKRGRIDHAMTLAVIEAARWDKVSWPANRSDGDSKHPDAIREGQRLRLDPRLDLSRYELSPFARMVAEAAQTYGFIVTDRSGAVAVSTESGAVQRARTGKDPWPWLLGGEAYTALANFPWHAVQVLPPDYGKPRR